MTKCIIKHLDTNLFKTRKLHGFNKEKFENKGLNNEKGNTVIA